MKRNFIINMTYYILLTTLLILFTNLNFTVMSYVWSAISVFMYVCILQSLKPKLRNTIYAIVTLLSFFIVCSNIIHMNVKGAFITVQQLGLIDELFATKGSISAVVDISYLASLLIPLLFIIMIIRNGEKEQIKLKKKYIFTILVSIIVACTVSFNVDKISFAAVYDPRSYVEEYGLANFYTRELLPFTKVNIQSSVKPEIIKHNFKEENALFKDKKNVVFVLAESLSKPGLSEELTPTLYKMKEQGMYFDNYYGLTYSTNENEFSMLTSQYPPATEDAYKWNPESFTSIPKMFEANNFCTTGAHANVGTFFKRDFSYPNFYGFQNSYFQEELGDPGMNDWPSDVNFFENLKPFISDKCDKDFLYLVSLTGHGTYSTGRPTAEMFVPKVQELYPTYNDEYQSYLATQMVFDAMMSDVEDYYESIGELDDTVFVIVADHHSYMLINSETDGKEYGKLFGKEIQDTYNVPFIIYDPSQQLDDNDSYAGNIDIMPTLAELFGFDDKYLELSAGSSLMSTENNRVLWHGKSDYAILSKDIKYSKDFGILEGSKDDVDALIKKQKEYWAYYNTVFDYTVPK